MNDVVTPAVAPASKSDRDLLLITYILYGLGYFTGGLTSVAAVIINHIKLGEITDPVVRSHHIWLMRTFWWSLLWAIVGGVLCLIVVGFAVLAVLFFWHLYRLIRGFIAMNEQRAMPI